MQYVRILVVGLALVLLPHPTAIELPPGHNHPLTEEVITLSLSDYISRYGNYYRVPQRVIRAVLEVESRMGENTTPRWEEHKQEHSYGLGQVLPSTAVWLAREGYLLPGTARAILLATTNVPHEGNSALNKVLEDAAINISLTAGYLRYQYDRYQDWEKAVAAYNAGSVRYVDDDETVYVNQNHVDKFNNALSRL